MPDLGRIFSLFYWFQLRPGPPSSLYWVLAGVYALGLGASVYYFVNVRLRFGEHAYRRDVAQRVGLAGGLLCGFGLVFVGLRFGGVPYGSLRVWPLITTLGAVGLGIFLAYYFWQRYPKALRAYEAEQLKQRYLPRPRGRAAGGARRRRRGR